MDFLYSKYAVVADRLRSCRAAILYCRHTPPFILILCITSALFFLNCGWTRTSKNIPFIGVGALIDKELAGGEADAFQVSLDSGQYMRVIVQQQGIEAKVALFGLDGQVSAEMESPYGIHASQSVSILADVRGDYRIEVRSSMDTGTGGRYKLRIEDIRDAEPSDITRVNAERVFIQARKLSSETGIEPWKEAIKKYEEALLRWQEISDRQEQATTIYCIGKSYMRLDNMQEAAKSFEQALFIQREVGYRRGEAYALNDLGLTQAHLGNQRKSMEYLFQALPIWREEKDKAREATTLNTLGGAHDNIGEPQKALEYYNQALEVRLSLHDLTGQASTLNNIGVIYDEYGEAQKALDNYKQALKALEGIKAPKLGDQRIKATALNNIGYAYEELGDRDNAFEYYNQALPLRQETKDRRGEAYTLINIGYVYGSMGEAQKALDYYNQALAIRKEIKDSWGEVYTLNYIGQAYASLGEPQRALGYYNQALELLKVVQDRQARASLLDKIGQAYVSLGQSQKAIGPFNEALALWKVLSDRRGEATTLLGIARVERDLGRLSRARNRIEAALEIIELLRTNISNSESRVFYFSSVQQYHSFYISLLMSMHKQKPSRGFDALAFQASERARARSLLDTLAEAHAEIHNGIDQSLLDRLRAVQQQVNAKVDYQMRMLFAKASEEEKSAAEKQVQSLLNQYQQIQAEVRASSPRYAALTQPQSLGVKQIQQQLLAPDTLMLEYSLGDERSYLWSISQASLKSYELPKRQELEDQAELVYKLLTARQPIDGESIESRQARVAQADADYWPQAARLSQMLLGPVASQLRDKRLLIITEGALQYVPFSALPAPLRQGGKYRERSKDDNAYHSSTSNIYTSNIRPLVLDHEIANLPSASVLALMRRENANRKPAPKSVAVFADPVFSKNDERVQSAEKRREQGEVQQLVAADAGRALRDFGATRDGLNLPRLLSLRREAEAIAAAAQPDQSMLALDFDANLTRAMDSEMGQYRIIHFATHGLLNNKNPELSAIVLSLVNPEGEPQDGLLKLNNIYNLNLSADLVVLSACDTGLGKQIKGEGLVGLTRGFIYAGAARVVASLWKVDSLQTEKLMKLFYKGMMTNRLPPLRSLQRAQVEMWSQSPRQAPYYWAAFILQGECN